MRVVAGSARGRRLRAPAGASTRPTSDRVREAVFDILSSMRALRGAAVADLFAGSGAMGIEALSRGAASAVFVEADPRAVSTIRENLEVTGMSDRADVVGADVIGWLRGKRGARFDLAFCDPPYSFDAWRDLLSDLSAEVAVLESNGPVGEISAWRTIKERSYGGTVVTVMTTLPPGSMGAS